MRIVLPLSAFAIVTLVIAYSVLHKPKIQIATTYQSREDMAGYVSMTAPSFTGLDIDGRYYVVTADDAIRPAGIEDRVELNHVRAEVMENGQARLSLNADKGTIDVDAGHLTFGPSVRVDLQDGFTLETDHAFADMNQGIIRGETPVRGISPFGTFSADRFEMARSSQIVRLSGHVRFTVTPAALEDTPENLRDFNERRAATRDRAPSPAPADPTSEQSPQETP
jgi:lipopolysaccharide export system protein LptC